MIVLRWITWLWQQTKKHRLLTVSIIVALVVFITFALVVLGFGWDWTGFNGGFSQVTSTSTSHGTTTTTVQPAGKTLWDLLQLLIIPIMLAIGGFWLNHIQKEREEKTTEQRTEIEKKAAEKHSQTEREIAQDNQREAALQEYIDKMSELLLDRKLRESAEDDETRKIARVRTLTVLPRLDGVRKGNVLQFLYESGLINKGKCIIILSGADLSFADLRYANLNKATLSFANLSSADLSKASLNDAELGGVNLNGANLRNAHLSSAYLSYANLSTADLGEARVCYANLSFANLNNAKLTGINLNNTNLSNATLNNANLSEASLYKTNLGGAKITPEQWDKAKSLKGATMPDGKKHL